MISIDRFGFGALLCRRAKKVNKENFVKNRDFQGFLTLKPGKYGVYISIRLPPTPGGGPPPKKSDWKPVWDEKKIVTENTGKISAGAD